MMRALFDRVGAYPLLSLVVVLAGCGGGADAAPNEIAEGTGGADTGGADGSTGAGGSSLDLDLADGGDSGEDPCLSDDPPAYCGEGAAGPACGDGEINQDSEACDDGNPLPGDGCNGICQIENGYECPVEGEPCVSTYVCGNGVLDPGEVCDDGNVAANDGCGSGCLSQDAGYICATPGEACTPQFACGDGRITEGETCDDGNDTSDDGCSDTCQVEDGWVCLVPDTPCTVASYCGDGTLNPGDGEVCDDGNTADGDGCTADCLYVESGWSCPTPGEACVNLVECGDGVVSGEEGCDDGDLDSSDGCSAECEVEDGYSCAFPGAPCVSICGDGIVAGAEHCDDGGTEDGDGCTADCHWEEGWACTGTALSSECHETTCGDGDHEGTEGCDDGNLIPGDGCDVNCQLEPSCTPGAGCSSACGDGLVISPETCDDGNNVDGDGCSSGCEVEDGYQCSNETECETINGTCVMRVPIVYRDFVESMDGGHVDFGGHSGSLTTGLVADLLDTDGLPVLVSPGSGGTSTAANFQQWYDYTQVSASDPPIFSDPLPSELILWDNGDGNFVNRYGENGEQWPRGLRVCSDTADDCGNAACAVSGTRICIPCPSNANYTCTAEDDWLDGNPLFLPLDDADGTVTSSQYDSPAKIPSQVYEGNWSLAPGEVGTSRHNWGFSSRVRYWFTYDADESYTLSFTGDDDVWVFVNGILAVDLGGTHMPEAGSVTINAANADTYTLVDGHVYDITMFHAERNAGGSSFMLTLSGFNSSPSVCIPVCGDGVVTPGEECDNGVEENIGGYGNCNPDCTRGEYCGDGEVNGDEECDDGVNVSGYALDPTEGCAAGCVLPPYCGDEQVQSNAGEQCDDGTNSGAYGTCDELCQRAPWCGDAIVQTDAGEECDDGKNDGTYGTCSPDCTLPPRCGDGELQEEYGEQCDLGAENGEGSGCSENCKLEGICGDGILQDGEECDDGSNLGGYGLCAPGCVYGPRCGDGVVQPDYEQCDDGTNDGGYGECAPGCVYGPHCGDEIVQSDYEECDDGPSGSGNCTSSCQSIAIE